MTTLASSTKSTSSRASHYTATRCLLCGEDQLALALPLKSSAVGNDYLREQHDQQKFSLNLHLCSNCGNVQIEDVVNPDLLFRAYTYSTTSSLGLVEHFRKYVAEIDQTVRLTPGSLVVDIGSNDGSLLKAFKEINCRVMGVDPAAEIAARATSAGVPTIAEYFTPEIAKQIRTEHGAAALVTANNVFAHSDRLPAMADGIRELLSPDGLFTFEVSYLLDIVQKMLFDTVYHEHLCYHSVRSLRAFFAQHGLQLIDIKRIPTKGGSLRGTVQHAGGGRMESPWIHQLIVWEQLTRLHSVETFRGYSKRIETAKDQLLSLIDRCRASGKVIAGYGASPTVTTLIEQFDLASRLDFMVDDNSVKQNTLSPGEHIPVYPPNAIYERVADVVVILAWNYAGPIMAKHRQFTETGGRFVIPLPCLQVN